MLEHALGAAGHACERFDGDDGNKNATLARFKQGAAKCLLATPQSGGVGLNIVECNHVIFTDRWFQPTLHEQAMDRWVGWVTRPWRMRRTGISPA